MKVIVLPGYSPHNKDWALEIKDYFDKNSKLETKVYEWRHWTSNKSMSIPFEVEKIKEFIENQDKVFIIAKSVGTRVLMTLATKYPEVKTKINKIVLCGIPTKLESKNTRNLYIEGLRLFDSKNMTIFQNKKDPFASYELVSKFISSEGLKIKIVRGERNDHNYPYYDKFLEFFSS